jgi:hypothetical protein
MNWVGQVGHVSAKDIRYVRWPILALLAALGMGTSSFLTRNAFGPLVSTGASSTTVTLAMSEATVTWLPLVIVVVGILAIASLVQADRPLQADSFWTTRPLAPSAVVVAKLLLAIVVITTPSLVAAAIVLTRLHTPSGVVLALLMHAALVHLLLLLSTIIVAAVTEDLKGFVTGAVVLFGCLIIAMTGIDELLSYGIDLPAGIAFLAAVAALVVLTVLYRGRRSGNRQRVIGLAAALLAIIGATAVPRFQISSVPMRATGPMLSLKFGAPGQTSMQLPFVVRVNDTSMARFAFARERTVIHGERGAVSLTPLHDTIVVGPQFPDIGRPIAWLNPPFDYPALGQLAISPADLRAVEQRATSAELTGVVSVLRPRILTTLPLRVGAFAEHDGRYVSIYGVSHDSNRVSVYVHLVSPPLIERRPPQLVIANFSRGEAMLLNEHPSAGTGSGWIVLPWISVASSFDQFATDTRMSVPQDGSWYAGASLIAVDWIPTERYNTSATMRLR